MKIKTCKFRSRKTAAVLRAQSRGHSDFNLSVFLASAVEDLAKFLCHRNARTKRERNTWLAAVRYVREGLEVFAASFFPEKSNRSAYWQFMKSQEEAVISMAELAA